jgi:hypothetical protein
MERFIDYFFQKNNVKNYFKDKCFFIKVFFESIGELKKYMSSILINSDYTNTHV